MDLPGRPYIAPCPGFYTLAGPVRSRENLGVDAWHATLRGNRAPAAGCLQSLPGKPSAARLDGRGPIGRLGRQAERAQQGPDRRRIVLIAAADRRISKEDHTYHDTQPKLFEIPCSC